MGKTKIYTAGAMSGLNFDQMNNWRVKAKELFNLRTDNIIIENPCNYYNFQRNPNTYTELEVKKFDLWLVKNCDIVLVNLEYPNSIGTAIEIHEAFDNWNIPVIAFGETKERPIHPWMNLCITKKCNLLEETVEHITNFYLPNI